VKRQILVFQNKIKNSTAFWKKEKTGIYCYHNSQIVIKLNSQQNGMASHCMKGTVRFTSKVFEFEIICFDIYDVLTATYVI